MQAILIRVGVDHSYGGWNAPADPTSGEFVYVPIPEKRGTTFHDGCERPYQSLLPALQRFADERALDLFEDLRCPPALLSGAMHLDPDFSTLTYGDVGDRRGSHIRALSRGDMLVFYAGLRPCTPCEHKLIYAIIGIFVVDEVVDASAVPEARWHENAHTRKRKRGASDIVVRAQPGLSGRLRQFIPIGEYRDRAYRVRKDLLTAWGGLTVNDGYIQRSARPPRFNQPERFKRWLDDQGMELMSANNPVTPEHAIVNVHLRQPRSGPNEMRTDPLWEFGSFGCTGCHRKNLMNPKRIDELDGVRVAFAQGGPLGFKLVMLTPPVHVVKHDSCCELKWEPASMPFCYAEAPTLIDANGGSDFPGISRMLRAANRTTWPARFSSKFRSRRKPLPVDLAAELTAGYERARQLAPAHAIATRYEQALPKPPPRIDTDRAATYQRLLSRQAKQTRPKRSC